MKTFAFITKNIVYFCNRSNYYKMKNSAILLLSHIRLFFKDIKYLSIILVVFMTIFFISYSYLSQINKIAHKELTIDVNSDRTEYPDRIEYLIIGIGISSNLLPEQMNSCKGAISIAVTPPNHAYKSMRNKEWINKYKKDVYFIADVQVKAKSGLPVPDDFKNELGVQLVHRSFKGLTGELDEYFDVIELTDTCVRFKHLMTHESVPESFYYILSSDLVSTSEAPWYKPIDIATISFSLKLNICSFNRARIVLDYSYPLNIMTVSPPPDEITPKQIIYTDSAKIERIGVFGIYFLAQDISKLHYNNMKSFWSATILGTCISIIAELVFRIVAIKRNKKQVQVRKRLNYNKKHRKKRT